MLKIMNLSGNAIKTTLRLYYTLITWAEIKEWPYQVLAGMWEKWTFHPLLMRMQKQKTVIVIAAQQFFQKLILIYPVTPVPNIKLLTKIKTAYIYIKVLTNVCDCFIFNRQNLEIT